MNGWVFFFSAGGLLLSLGAFLVAFVGLRRRTKVDYTTQLEHKLEDVQEEAETKIQELQKKIDRQEAQLEECRTGRERLQRQNYELMTRMFDLEHGKGGS